VHSSPKSLQANNLGIVERWASIVGGATLLGYSMKKQSVSRPLLALLGGDLIYCGISGYSPLHQAFGLGSCEKTNGRPGGIAYKQGIRVDKSITINQPREQVYNFWRDLENLPRFMRHLHSVTKIDGNQSHWIAAGPAGKMFEWDATIINDEPNALIGWSSLPGSEVETAGSVHFEDAPGGRGTVISLELQYNPPGGQVAAAFAKLLGGDPADQIADDLRRLKQFMETGEVATTVGQSTGKQALEGSKRAPRPRRVRAHRSDKVQEASEESFPASDPPSWTAPKEQLVS